MPSSNVCWGIEVGAGGIKALKLEASGGSLNVLDFAVLPHKKVLSMPELDQADALRVALGAFTSQFDLTGASLAVSVPGHSAFARFAKLPPVEPKKIPDIVKFEAVQQIPFPIDDVEWDYQTFVSPDSPEVEVGIFAITRDRIMEKLTMFDDVGISPDFVTLSPVAAYNAIAYDLAFNEQTPGTILLDIGTTSTDLIVAEPGRVWIRTFPIGGHHFTEALVSKFQLSYAKAEKLKREAESTQHARHVFQAMRPVFGDLAQDVQRSIGYYQSLHKDAKLTRLIGLGSTFRLPGLRKFLRQQLQIDVYRMEQFKRVSAQGTRAGEFQQGTLNLATAYGLALQGLGEAALDVNLMPARVIKVAMWRRKVPWFGVAAAVAIAGSGAQFIRPFIDQRTIADNPRPEVVRDVIQRVNSLKSDASDVTGGGGNMEAADILGLLDNRHLYARVVSDVSSMLSDAEKVARNWKADDENAPKPTGPAYVVNSLKTTYIPPDAGVDSSGMPLAGGALPARIDVELELTTMQPSPRRFVSGTIESWLMKNKDQSGSPFTLANGRVDVGPPMKIEAVEVKPDAVANETRFEYGRGAAPGGRPPQGERNEAGAFVEGLIVTGSGETRTPGTTGVSETQKAFEEMLSKGMDAVRAIAPFPQPPQPPPGTTVTKVKVRWTAQLRQAAPKEGGGL